MMLMLLACEPYFELEGSKTGFTSLRTTDILGYIEFSIGGGGSAESIALYTVGFLAASLHPLDASSTSPSCDS